MPYCPACNRPVDWIPQYGQFWCHACQRYYPTARDSVDNFFNQLGAQVAPPACNWCGAPLEFIGQYQRWFCHRCQQYK
jgi:tRNA(Ile2) C34 agmatinyltransferase TiaS